MIRGRTRTPDLDPTGRVPQHQLGKIIIGGVKYQLLRLGTWSSTANYLPGNVVTFASLDYLCILANTNQATSNATYWQPFDETQLFLRGDRVFSKLDTPLQGIYQNTGLVVPTVTGGGALPGSASVSWSYSSGDAVFNLATPTFPGANAAGVYSVTVNVKSSSGWTPGAKLGVIIDAAAPLAIVSWNEVLADASGVMPAASATLTFLLGLAQTFTVEIDNWDTAAHTVDVSPIVAVMIRTD